MNPEAASPDHPADRAADKPAGEEVVRISHLTHRFDADATIRPVLDDVSMDVLRGEFVILRGPSGAGKTTLLTIIGALRDPQEGEVRVLGKDPRQGGEPARAALRRSIGFVFQNHHLFDELTARETLELAMRLVPHRYQPADYRRLPDEWLERLGVAHRRDARPAKMSTGQRQRVAIARAMINEPALILADEPTASLDSESAAISLQCLSQAAAQGRSSVVMISHDARHDSLAHRVISMVDGRIDRIEPGGAAAQSPRQAQNDRELLDRQGLRPAA